MDNTTTTSTDPQDRMFSDVAAHGGQTTAEAGAAAALVADRERAAAALNAAVLNGDRPPAPEQSGPDAPARPPLDEDIWAATPIMEQVRAWAGFCLTSPWALLAVMLARVAAEDSHYHHLQGKQGGRVGSSNAAVHFLLVGHSESGKSSTLAEAEQALDIRGGHLPARNRWVNLKTAEGMLHFYFDRTTETVETEDGGTEKRAGWKQTRHAALGYADELKALYRIASRSNNYLLEELSSVWSGRPTARTTLSDPMPSPALHTHFSFVGAAQDHILAPILEGEALYQGWTNRLIPIDAIWPEAMTEPARREPPPRIPVQIPNCGICPTCCPDGKTRNNVVVVKDNNDVRKKIIEQRRIGLAGLQTEIPHYHFNWLRTAKAVAALHSKLDIEPVHLEIASLIMEHSKRLRSFLSDNLPSYITEAEQSTNMRKVISSQTIKHQDTAAGDILARIASRLYKATGHGNAGFTATDVNDVLNGRDRKILSMNGKQAGTAAAQVIRSLYDAITWDGRDDGEEPGRGTRFFWEDDPSEPL